MSEPFQPILPDRLTVSMKIMSKLDAAGVPYTAEDIEQETTAALDNIFKNYRKGLSDGEKLYQAVGNDASVGYLDQMLHQFGTMGSQVVPATKAAWANFTRTDDALKASEDARKGAKKIVQERIARNPELQAYYAWKEDETGWSNPDTWQRSFFEAAPSLAVSIGGAVVGSAIGGFAGGPGGAAIGGRIGSMLGMATMIGTSKQQEAQGILVDEMGMTPREAIGYSSTAALIQTAIESTLEYTGAKYFLRSIPGASKLIPGLDKGLLKSITGKLVDKGAGKPFIKKAGWKGLGWVTNVADGVIREGGTEYIQAISGVANDYALRHGLTGENIWEGMKEGARSKEAREEGFAGATLAFPASFFGLGVSSSEAVKTGQREAASLRRAAEADALGGTDDLIDESLGINSFLSAIISPMEKMGDFIANWESQEKKPTGALAKALNDSLRSTDAGATLLKLIKADPKVVTAIENHADAKVLTKLIAERLNKEVLGDDGRHINTDDYQESIDSIKIFAEKGDIKTTQTEESTDIEGGVDESYDITFDTNLIGTEVNDDLFREQEQLATDEEVAGEGEATEEGKKEFLEQFESVETDTETDTETEEETTVKPKEVKLGDVLQGDEFSDKLKSKKKYKGKKWKVTGITKGGRVNLVRLEDGKIVESGYVMKRFLPGQEEDTTKEVAESKEKPLTEKEMFGDETEDEDIGEEGKDWEDITGQGTPTNLLKEAQKKVLKMGLTVPKLQKILRERGLDDSGKKQDLVKRLAQDVLQKEETSLQKIVKARQKAKEQYEEVGGGIVGNAYVGGQASTYENIKENLGKEAAEAYKEEVDKFVQIEVDKKLAQDAVAKKTKAKLLRSNNKKQLQKMASDLGLDTEGNKSDIANRILEQQAETTEAEPTEAERREMFEDPETGPESQLDREDREPDVPKSTHRERPKTIGEYRNRMMAKIASYKKKIANWEKAPDSNTKSLVLEGANGLKAKLAKAETHFEEDVNNPDITIEELIEPENFQENLNDIQGFIPTGGETETDTSREVTSGEDVETRIGDNQNKEIKQTRDKYVIEGQDHDRVTNKIGSLYQGNQSDDSPALKAGSNVDSIVRQFFIDDEMPPIDTTKMTSKAYEALKEALEGLRDKLKSKGYIIHADNVVVWDSNASVAGEVDLLVFKPKTGKFSIIDIKTSSYTVHSPAYTKPVQGNTLKRSKEKQHRLQLSMYKRILENQYNSPDLVEDIIIYPLLIDRNGMGKVMSLKSEAMIVLEFDKAAIDNIVPSTQTISTTEVKEKTIKNVSEKGKGTDIDPNLADPDVDSIDWDNVDESLRPSWASTDKKTDKKTESAEEADKDDDVNNEKENDAGYDDKEILMQQEDEQSMRPKVHKDKPYLKKLLKRLRKHWGKHITDEAFYGTIEKHGLRAVGMAVGKMAYWSQDKAYMDTLPHEYFHIYLDLMIDSDVVQKALKQLEAQGFTGEAAIEELATRVGLYYMMRMDKSINKTTEVGIGGDIFQFQFEHMKRFNVKANDLYKKARPANVLKQIGNFLKQFWNRLKNIFGKVTQEDAIGFIAEEFFQGRWLGPMGQYGLTANFQAEEEIVDPDGRETGEDDIGDNHTTNIQPSIDFLVTFYHKTTGIMMKNETVYRISDLANEYNSFEEYLPHFIDFIKEVGSKSHQDVKTDYTAEQLASLKNQWVKDKTRIYRARDGRRGPDTRMYKQIVIPDHKHYHEKGEKSQISMSPMKRPDDGQTQQESYTRNFFEDDLLHGFLSYAMKITHFKPNEVYHKRWVEEGKRDWYHANIHLVTPKILEKIQLAENMKFLVQLVALGPEVAYHTHWLGAKGSDKSEMLQMQINSDMRIETQKEWDDYLDTEVSEGRMKDSHADIMREQFKINEDGAKDTLRMILNGKLKGRFEKYFKMRQKKGETLAEAKSRISREILPILAAREVNVGKGLHEYLKAIKYDTYAMNEKHIIDTYNRLQIPFSEGPNPIGIKPQGSMMVPLSTIVKRRYKRDGKTVLEDAGTIEQRDGGTITGTRAMNDIGQAIGTEHMRTGKTAIRVKRVHENKEDDYVALKHMETVPHIGMEYYRPGEKVPFARVVGSDEGSYFEMLDDVGRPTGETFDRMYSPNEAKEYAGSYGNMQYAKPREDGSYDEKSGYYKINMVEDRDIKIIKNPQGSAVTAAHPVAMGEMLLDPTMIDQENHPDTYSPEAFNLLQEIYKHYDKIIGSYLKDLDRYRNNPKALLAEIKRQIEDGRVPTEGEKWLEFLDRMGGAGVHAGNIIPLYAHYLNNKLFKKGIFKARNKQRGHATHLVIKPADHLKFGDKEFAVSSDNKVVRYQVMKDFIDSKGLRNRKEYQIGGKMPTYIQAWQTYVKLNKLNFHDQMKALNKYLEGNDNWWLIHRQPVAKLTGMGIRNLNRLVEGGHGEAIFMSESDVKDVLDADWDGDDAFAERVSPELAKAYLDFQNSDTYIEKNKIVGLTMFGLPLEKDDTQEDSTALSKENIYDAIVGISATRDAQGRMTNAKTVFMNLAFKAIRIIMPHINKGKGFLSVRQPTDLVQMEYLPLDARGLNTIWKGEKTYADLTFDNGDDIVVKDGDSWVSIQDNKRKYFNNDGSIKEGLEADLVLQTTFEHELSIMFQNAVDNKKFGNLYKMQWNDDFPLTRMFIRSDGKDLTTKDINTARVMFNIINFSKQRQGRNAAGFSSDMTDVINESAQLSQRFWNEEGKPLSQSEKEDVLLSQFNEEAQEKWTNKKGRTKKTAGIRPTKIEWNGKFTPGEMLIASIGKKWYAWMNQLKKTDAGKDVFAFLGNHFFDYSADAYGIAHIRAMKVLSDELESVLSRYSKEDLAWAYQFLLSARTNKIDANTGMPKTGGKKISVVQKFYDIYDQLDTSYGNSQAHISADYSKPMMAFLQDHLEEFLSLSEAQQDIVNILFLKGIQQKKNVTRMLPFDLLSTREGGIMEKYMPKLSKELLSLKSKDKKVRQGGKMAENKQYKRLHKLSIEGAKEFNNTPKKYKIKCKA
jgi:hypothetical protein